MNYKTNKKGGVSTAVCSCSSSFEKLVSWPTHDAEPDTNTVVNVVELDWCFRSCVSFCPVSNGSPLYLDSKYIVPTAGVQCSAKNICMHLWRDKVQYVDLT